MKKLKLKGKIFINKSNNQKLLTVYSRTNISENDIIIIEKEDLYEEYMVSINKISNQKFIRISSDSKFNKGDIVNYYLK